MSFRLTREPIDSAPATSAADGAIATFVGIVRDHNEGRSVASLEYEAYEELALAEGQRILDGAVERFAISSASCAHRVGHLRIGETAIRVDVIAPHRDPAFQACRHIVDEVKCRVPIWKREHYTDGTTEWVNCARPREPSAYYSRQVRLAEVGEGGQRKLAEAKVLVVGAGGLGCAALQYLAAAGIGEIGICEPDALEESNLHRQTLYAAASIGREKATLAVERLCALNPYITIRPHHEAISRGNAERLLEGYNVVLDCTDNFDAKFLLNDAAIRAGKTLVQASIHQFEGQILVTRPDGPCLRCVWPEMPEEGCVGTCAEAGVLGFVPGVFGALQSTEAIKLILGLPRLDRGEMLIMDLLDYSLQRLSIPRIQDCPGCGTGTVERSDWILSADDIEDATIIDIRDQNEIEDSPLPIDNDWVPEPELVLASASWSRDRRYVLVCERGIRSARSAIELRERGLIGVYSLSGGAQGMRRALAGKS